MAANITAYGQSDIGRFRETNQDAFICGNLSDNAVFAVVCDGMGGGKDGNIASAISVRVVSNRIVENYRDDIKETSLKNIMLNAIDTANIEIFDYSSEDESYKSMGTTIVAAIIIDRKMHLAHVGDSRAYFVNNEKLLQITKDHTLVQSMVEEGRITATEARNHPRKNLITRAVGIEHEIKTDYSLIDIEEKNGVLICTDGLTNMLDDNSILNFIKKEKNPSDVPARLIHEANMAGGSDNITVVYLV